MALADIALRIMGAGELRHDSVRPPSGAVSSPTYNAIPHQPLWPGWEGPTSINLAERNLYAFRCIETIANSISGLPIVAGNVKSRAARPSTRMMNLLGEAPGGPNPLWSSAKLMRYAVSQYLILGKFAWLHEYDKQGRIIALWPLMAQWLVPVVAGLGAPNYFEKFRYGSQGSPGYREFTPDQITYIWRPSLHDFRQPEAPLKLAAYGIKIAHLLDQFDDGFLSNGGVPTHLIITPPFDTAPERRSFRDQFRRKMTGVANANKAMFAETENEPGEFGTTSTQQTIDVKVIGQSQKDSQMDVMRSSRIVDMCVNFGVPLSLLGDSSNSKYTNMEVDRDNYWKETIKPKLAELADAINLTLGVRLDGPNDVMWFDTSSVPELRKAPVFTEAGGIAAVAAGVITPDEYREDRGLPPLPDNAGDTVRPPLLGGGKGGAGTQALAAEAAAGIPVGLPDTAAGGSPEAPPVPPLRAVATRVDLMPLVRDQLATELASHRHEIEARLAGKRGGRKRAHAQLDLALAYEVEHWAPRMARNLGPTLRTAGFSDDQIEDWSTDVTEKVYEQLHMQQSVQSTFEPEAYMGLLSHGGVDAGYLEHGLKQISAGRITGPDFLAALGA